MEDLFGSVATRRAQLARVETEGMLTIDWLRRQLLLVLTEIDVVEPELERELERHEDF